MSDFNQLYQDIESGNILPDQIYNLDIDYPQFFAIEHYKKYKHELQEIIPLTKFKKVTNMTLDFREAY